LIDKFFDKSIGSKTDSGSFEIIAQNIGMNAKNTLFITDNQNG
jgi:methionine salvage enolase-phosphatase E1